MAPLPNSPTDGATAAISALDLDLSPTQCSTAELLIGLGGTARGVTVAQVKAAVTDAGFLPNDPRLASALAALEREDDGSPLTPSEFLLAARDNLTLLHRVATKELAVSDFSTFTEHIKMIMDRVAKDESGENADYIPILRDANSDRFGVSFCSVDGQVFEVGDTRDEFSVQSTTKAVTYAAALQQLGTDGTLEYCGVEPSGRPFNDLTLLADNRPPNPMVNSGALMNAALLASCYPELCDSDGPNGVEGTYGEDLFDSALIPVWRKLTGDGIVGDVGFSEETFLSERNTADTNRAIAFVMKAKRGLPPKVGPETMLDFYLRSCSITANCTSMAILAATLGNGGNNPVTKESVFQVDVVKHVLSVMTFCGQYDGAGEFFLHSGMPSKSGVSGIVIMVLPNVGAFATFSPRLNEQGNSVRGVAFAKELVKRFTFHMFDSLSSPSTSCKLDPRFSCDYSTVRANQRLRWAVEAGDRKATQFSNFLIEVCLRVALVDGSLDEQEIAASQAAYEAIMGVDVDAGAFKKVLDEVDAATGEEALQALNARAASVAFDLTDNEKGVCV